MGNQEERAHGPRTMALVRAYVGVLLLSAGSLATALLGRSIARDAALLVASVPHRGVVTDAFVKTDVELDGQQAHQISFDYEYEGKPYSNISSGTGPVFAKLRADMIVPIEVVPASPSIARIRGGEASVFGLWAALVLLLPLVGIVLTVQGLRAIRPRNTS
jgi:hypothetical protein